MNAAALGIEMLWWSGRSRRSFPAKPTSDAVPRRSGPPSVAFLQVHIRKLEKLLPVVLGYRVDSGAIVKADGMHDGLVERRQLRDAEPLLAKQFEHGRSGIRGQDGPKRVRPLVIFCAVQVNRSRRNQRDQLVRVHRQLVNMVAVLLKVPAEPPRKRGIDALRRFAVIMPQQ